MLTIDGIIERTDRVKGNTIFGEAGLNASTMRNVVRYRCTLREAEVLALTAAPCGSGSC